MSVIAADVALFESVHISFCLINAKYYSVLIMGNGHLLSEFY